VLELTRVEFGLKYSELLGEEEIEGLRGVTNHAHHGPKYQVFLVAANTIFRS
jgi:hypothetical protein